MTRIIWTAAALAFSGCTCASSPLITEQFACRFTAECALGYVCVDDQCVRNGSGGGGGGLGEGGGVGGQGGDGGGDEDAGLGGGGGGAGGGDDGGGGQGGGGTVDSGVPGLRFGPLVNVPEGVCQVPAHPMTVEYRSAAGVNVAAPSDIPLVFSSATPGLVFFAWSDAGCVTPMPLDGGYLLPMGSKSVPFFARALDAGTYDLTVASDALAADTASFDVWKSPLKLAFNPSPPRPRVGDCQTVSVELRDNDGVTVRKSWADTTVFASGGPGVANLQVSSTLLCTPDGGTAASDGGVVPALLLPFGQSSVSFTLKDKKLDTNKLFAWTNLTRVSPVNVDVTVRSPALRGTCAILPAQASVDCAIPAPGQVDLTNTLLLFQATGPQSQPSALQVRCDLLDVTTVRCSRSGAGFSNPVNIAWQTLEWFDFDVQHKQTACPNGAKQLLVPLTGTVPLARSFLLSSQSRTTANWSEGDFFSGKLINNSTVRYDSVGTCSGQTFNTQVVSVPGISVQRNQIGPMGAGESLTSADAGFPSGTSIAGALWLFSTQWGPGTNDCSKYLWSIPFFQPQLSFLRESGVCSNAPIPEIAWERIDFGARASHQFALGTMPAGSTSMTLALPTFVDPARTIVVTSNQTLNGQGVGELAPTDGGTDANVGDVVALHQFTFDGGMVSGVQLTRATSKLDARWFVWVTTFNLPP